jgi:signal-transduction protein with cAMP-binding, CBS, and nucleotidyltransferase domain
MPQKIRDVMTIDPTTISVSATLVEAARAMRDQEIGDVVVLDDSGQLCGIVTDRDVAVRAVAEGRDPNSTSIGEICSRDVATVTPDDSIGDAVRLMSEKAVRRLPVIENGRVAGIVSLGDLAIEQDPDSALADISEAPANT